MTTGTSESNMRNIKEISFNWPDWEHVVDCTPCTFCAFIVLYTILNLDLLRIKDLRHNYGAYIATYMEPISSGMTCYHMETTASFYFCKCLMP